MKLKRKERSTTLLLQVLTFKDVNIVKPAVEYLAVNLYQADMIFAD
jgi:hypothetical protein